MKKMLFIMLFMACEAQAVSFRNISSCRLEIEPSNGENFSLVISEKYYYGNRDDCRNTIFTITSPECCPDQVLILDMKKVYLIGPETIYIQVRKAYSGLRLFNKQILNPVPAAITARIGRHGPYTSQPKAQ